MKTWVRWVTVSGLALLACRSEGGKPVGHSAEGAEGHSAAAASADVTARETDLGPLPRGQVIFTDAFGGKHVVEAEVAATRAARTRGLMWRQELPAGKGMLFIFPAQEPLTFWMKNTLIPLDMIFVSQDLRIVGIVEQAEPLSLASRGPREPAKYVVEVPAGYAQAKALRSGLAVQLQGVGAVPVTDD